MPYPHPPESPLVVKVGGSLFDLEDLGPRLYRWLGERAFPRVVIVPGGGRTADVVRDLDRFHRLGEETAHWLALQALTLNAHFLAELLVRQAHVDAAVPSPGGGAIVSGTPSEWPALWARGLLVVVDAHQFARVDEGRRGSLPHTWAVTSDSVAARVAHCVGARRVNLLKSASPTNGAAPQRPGPRGYVDSFFSQAAEGLEVVAVNFRRATAPDSKPAAGRERGR
jgi:hypothetical protein